MWTRIYAGILVVLLAASGTTAVVEQTTTAAEPTAKAPDVSKEAQAVIEGDTSYAAGDLVFLDASKSVAKDFAWTMTPESKRWRAIEGGKVLVFASGTPGTYTAILAVAGGDKVAIKLHTFTIGNVPPVPPGPIPPGPTPPEPPAPTGLQAKVLAWAMTVQSPNRLIEAGKIATNYRGIASQIGAGVLKDPEAVMTASKEANIRVLGADVAKVWLPFGQALASELEALDAAGKLATVSDYAPVWEEIAKGLELVKAKGN